MTARINRPLNEARMSEVWLDGNSAHHYREHAEQIRTWRKSKRI